TSVGATGTVGAAGTLVGRGGPGVDPTTSVEASSFHDCKVVSSQKKETVVMVIIIATPCSNGCTLKYCMKSTDDPSPRSCVPVYTTHSCVPWVPCTGFPCASNMG